MRYTRAILSAAIVLFGLLGLALVSHSQTVPPPQPTTPCANGQPWQYHPNAKYKWQCPAKIACARTCTYNAAAPAGQKCVNDVRKDATFVQGQKARGTPVVLDPADPDLYHVFIYGPDHTIDVSMERDKNGYECAGVIRYYYGEWPLGDPRNLIPVTPVATPATQSIMTELLPLLDLAR